MFIADEIQTGIGRTGSLLAVCGDCTCASACEQQESYTRPDILILGKALSGGTYPVSAVLADNRNYGCNSTRTTRQHLGGNPVAANVGMAALEVVAEENLLKMPEF